MEISNYDIVRIVNSIDAKKEEIEEFTLNCIKQLSENPPGDESKIADLFIRKAKEWKLEDPEIWMKKENRPNLFFNINGKGNGKTLILNGHMDTKPIGDIAEWRIIDPCKPQIIDGKIYGRGSTDMKGALVGMLAAANAIVEDGLNFKGKLVLSFTADEEAGSTYGAKYISERGFDADAIIVGEPSGVEKDFDTIGLACRGALLGKIVVYGTQMHSSLSDKGGCINASIKMAEVLVEFSKNLKNNLNYKNHYLYPNGPTINPGVTIDGGVFYGVVPGIASFGFDLRTIPGMEFKQVVGDINKFLNKLMAKDKDLKAELVLEGPKISPWVAPAEISQHHPVVESCIKATEAILNFKPEKVGVPFGTDSCFIVDKLKIPTISSFGPGYIKLAHGPDEYVDIKAIIDSAKIYAIAALIFLNY